MGIAVGTASLRRMLLVSAITLTMSGFASLVFNTNSAPDRAPRVVGPHFSSPTTDGFDSWDTTTTTLHGRHRTNGGTWVSGDFIDVPTDLPPGSTTTTGPQTEPPTQVQVGVPPAGAEVSVGQGPGSCTDVAITALTPDNCSPAPGDGPVNVDPGPSGGPFSPRNGTLA